MYFIKNVTYLIEFVCYFIRFVKGKIHSDKLAFIPGKIDLFD